MIFLLLFQIIKAQDCYEGNGNGYRGSTSLTKSGQVCGLWARTPLAAVVGAGLEGDGNNYCRNPDESFMSPWCYIQQGDVFHREECSQIPRCKQNLRRKPVLPPTINEIIQSQNQADPDPDIGTYLSLTCACE